MGDQFTPPDDDCGLDALLSATSAPTDPVRLTESRRPTVTPGRPSLSFSRDGRAQLDPAGKGCEPGGTAGRPRLGLRPTRRASSPRPRTAGHPRTPVFTEPGSTQLHPDAVPGGASYAFRPAWDAQYAPPAANRCLPARLLTVLRHAVASGPGVEDDRARGQRNPAYSTLPQVTAMAIPRRTVTSTQSPSAASATVGSNAARSPRSGVSQRCRGASRPPSSPPAPARHAASSPAKSPASGRPSSQASRRWSAPGVCPAGVRADGGLRESARGRRRALALGRRRRMEARNSVTAGCRQRHHRHCVVPKLLVPRPRRLHVSPQPRQQHRGGRPSTTKSERSRSGCVVPARLPAATGFGHDSQTKVCDTGADRRAPSSSFRSRCVRSRRRSPCPPAGCRASAFSADTCAGRAHVARRRRRERPRPVREPGTPAGRRGRGHESGTGHSAEPPTRQNQTKGSR